MLPFLQILTYRMAFTNGNAEFNGRAAQKKCYVAPRMSDEAHSAVTMTTPFVQGVTSPSATNAGDYL